MGGPRRLNWQAAGEHTLYAIGPDRIDAILYWATHVGPGQDPEGEPGIYGAGWFLVLPEAPDMHLAISEVTSQDLALEAAQTGVERERVVDRALDVAEYLILARPPALQELLRG